MANPPDPIDLRHPAPQKDRIEIQELSPYSSEWARIVKPVALSLLGLIAAVMLLPFLIVVYVGNGQTGDQIIDWAKTVLPPVVGFGGALVGYYFGTRSNLQDTPSEE